MKITPLVYGWTTLPESMIFDGGDKSMRRRIVLRSFLIEYRERLILIDAGCVTMPGYEVDNHIGPVCALEKIGISAEDITDLVLTHHHHDHTECAASFSGAAVYIQRDEYPLAKHFISSEARVVLFDDEYSFGDGLRVIRIGGHTKGSCIVSAVCDGREYIISGDECYHSDCLKYRTPTGCAYDKERAQAFIDEYSKEKYTVLVMHGEEISNV